MAKSNPFFAMRAYIATTCILCGLLILAHIARLFAESIVIATDPFFLIPSIASIAMLVWGLILILTPSRSL